MAVFFTADTHFGHAAARAFHRRPFASVVEMDRAMVERWNAAVGPGDEVWHLGDVAAGLAPGAAAALLDGLNGRKHLVTGNNDPDWLVALPQWASVRPYAEVEVGGRGAVLCHYAFRTWRNMHKGWANLHGHSHGRLRPRMARQVDVGVDAWGFRPVTLDEALAGPGAATMAPQALEAAPPP